jgi:MFS family permease
VFLLGIPGIALARDTPAAAQPTSSADHPDDARRAVKNTAASWMTIIRTAPAIVAGTAVFAAFDNITLSFLPLFVLEQGMTQRRALVAVVIVFAGDAMMQFAAGWLADRFGQARVHRLSGLAMCGLLPLLPVLSGIPGLWEFYLFVLGGVAGSIYTLSMILSGERFSGAALLRASGLIALSWNLASSVGPAITGVVVQHFGGRAMTVVLWIMALGFVWTTHRRRRPSAAPAISPSEQAEP